MFEVPGIIPLARAALGLAGPVVRTAVGLAVQPHPEPGGEEERRGTRRREEERVPAVPPPPP